MCRLVLVTHGDTATAMKRSTRMFFGDMVDQIIALEFHTGDSLEEFTKKVENVVTSDEDDYMFMVDIPSGTPYNVVALVIDKYGSSKNIECLAGVNMPMIMEALSMINNHDTLEGLVEHLQETSKASIVNLRARMEI